MQNAKMGKTRTTSEDSRKGLKRYIAEQLRDGQDKFTLIKELTTGKGLQYMEASRLVNEVHQKFIEYDNQKRKRDGDPIFLEVLLKSLGAALLSGALWGGLVITADLAQSWGALVVGAICGWVVMKVSKDQEDGRFQLVAVFVTFCGIFVGKYVEFCFITSGVLAQQGANLPADHFVFKGSMIVAFFSHLGDVFGASGLIFTILAMALAWFIPLFFRNDISLTNS